MLLSEQDVEDVKEFLDAEKKRLETIELFKHV